MSDSPNKLSQFWQELKRRRVIHVIIVYATAAYVIIELINNVTEPLNLPDWTPTLIIIILFVGFPLAIIFSWIFDVTTEGIEKTKPTKEIKNIEFITTPNSWKIATYVSLVIIVGLVAFNIFGGKRGSRINDSLDKSIAVLPFINDSEDKGNEHIINGIMEEILINLQSIKDLRVPGRTSVEQYRNNPKSISEIASEMNVAYLVEGSGQRYGNKIRLRVQLVEGATDKHIWADSYDEEINKLEDIFRIQSQIAKSIARELQAVITPEEQQLIEKMPTSNMDAYDLYLRGLYYYNLHTNWWEIADYFERSIQLDSLFALAYVKLAQCYQFIHRYSYKIEGDDYSRAKQLVLKAIDLDTNLGEAYAALGLIMAVEDWDIYEPDQVFKKAIRLSPSNSEVYLSYGQYLRWLGKYEEAIFQAKQALELDPLSPTAHQWLARFYSHAGDFKESNHLLEQVLNLNPDYFQAYLLLAQNNTYEEKYSEAIKFAEKAMRYDPVMREALSLSWLTYFFGEVGQEEKARQLLQKIIYTSKQRFVDPVFLAIAYTGLGEIDSAFSQLSTGYEIHSGTMIYLRAMADGELRDISADPRYRSLLMKMGFKD